ncbi:MAG: hypothetical protein OXG72_07810 [Acidobacteria bacterium]|nr:hypothetical protein [Acidobacteriota bacterium]
MTLPAADAGSSEGRAEVDHLVNARQCIADYHVCMTQAQQKPDMAGYWQARAARWADRAIWWAQQGPAVEPS